MNDKMTNDIKHHLSDDVLLAYAGGNLAEAFNLIVAVHISMCDTCRAQSETFEALGGGILDTMTSEIGLDEGSLEATMARIAQQDSNAIKAPRPRQRDAVLPQPLMDYVGGGLDTIRWRPVGMGVNQAILKTSPEATARLLLIPAGAAMPNHSHSGTEMTLVLKGAFQDDDGYFARGDVETAGSDLHHTPVADIHEDCICLAVTEAPLRFTGILPRLAQRFFRI
mgnify:CR=1 FL=1